MARRGVFGRRPRSAPSLTSQIVAIAQQMQAARDRNIMDAWQNGGEFEGAPATDDRVLAYWKDRLKGISPKDPLYDQYSNQVMQFEYAVEESKNSLLYAQGKIGDGARAQFFLNWAKKIDPDTEFYRTLQKNAAQFLQRVRSGSGGGGGGGGSRAASSARADVATQNEYELLGNTLTSWLTQFAQAEQFIGEEDDLTDLSFAANNGPARMIELINRLNQSPAVLEQLQKIDPTFSGQLTYEYYLGALQRQQTGLQIRYQRAMGDGRTGDAKTAKNALDDMNTFMRKTSMWDTAQSYLAERKSFLLVWEDPYASPDAKIKAWSQYRQGLLDLASDPNNPVDGATKTTLEGEANLNPQIDSWYENFTRARSVSASTTSGDNAETLASVKVFLAEYQSVNDGTGGTVWTYGERNSKGVFTPKAGGTLVGATSALLAQQAGAKLVLVPQADGSALTVYVAPVPVTAVARNEFGEKLDAMRTRADGTSTQASAQIGNVLNVWIGNQMTQVYEYRASDGTMRYTTTPVWGPAIQADGGYVVDVSASVAAGTGAIKDKNNGETVGFLPTVAQDPIRRAAGINEMTDFVTPLLAVMSSTPEGREQLQKANQDPALRQLITDDFARNAAALAPEVQQIAYTKFLAQLTQSGDKFVHGTSQAGWVGIGAEYDNRSNAGAFDDVQVVVPPSEAAKQGEFLPIARLMTVPGRFGNVDPRYDPSVYEDRQGVQIIKPNSLVVPDVPKPIEYWNAAPGQALPPPPTPMPEPIVVAPLPTVYTTPFEEAAAPVGGSLSAYQTPGLTAEDLAAIGTTTRTSGGMVGF